LRDYARHQSTPPPADVAGDNVDGLAGIFLRRGLRQALMHRHQRAKRRCDGQQTVIARHAGVLDVVGLSCCADLNSIPL
jgi:hypothetical protein